MSRIMADPTNAEIEQKRLEILSAWHSSGSSNRDVFLWFARQTLEQQAAKPEPQPTTLHGFTITAAPRMRLVRIEASQQGAFSPEAAEAVADALRAAAVRARGAGMSATDAALSAAAAMRDAIEDLILVAEQRASDEGAADLIEVTPEYDAARAARDEWDSAIGRARADG